MGIRTKAILRMKTPNVAQYFAISNSVSPHLTWAPEA
jgi:hypothetical protein